MPHRDSESGRSFTLLELALVLFLLAATAVVALPVSRSGKAREAEGAAVLVLLDLHARQTTMRRDGGAGTPAWLEELTGDDRSRALPARLCDLAAVARRGVATLGGYCFTVYLSDEKGRSTNTPEPRESFQPVADFWVAYAWPLRFGAPGRDVYAITADGTVFASENTVPPFEGPSMAPPATILGAGLGKSPLLVAENRGRKLRWREVPVKAPR